MPAKYSDYDMDTEGYVFNYIHHQDGVTAGVGGMSGYEDGRVLESARATADVAAAIHDQTPAAIDVTHVLLASGHLVHVGLLHVVGVNQGQLVIERH